MTIEDHLDSLLDKEESILLSGKFSELSRLLELKEEIIKYLEKSDKKFSRKNIQKISLKAKRNEALLESAQRGIKAAVAQVREAKETNFQSYSREGARYSMAAKQSFGKKA
jgi:flagellar biosynthesis/type III secretory pathway chaperone